MIIQRIIESLRVIFRYLLPSFISFIIARLTLAIPSMILGEIALSFIGLGLQAPAISWGVLLKDAQAIRVLALSPWLLLPAIFVRVQRNGYHCQFFPRSGLLMPFIQRLDLGQYLGTMAAMG